MKDAHPLTQMVVSTRVLKRAQYEAFEFTLHADGIRIRNESYSDPEHHEYLITLEEGHPVECTCPADARFHGACKHRVAVAIRRPILDAAQQHAVVPDGGSDTESVPKSAIDEYPDDDTIADHRNSTQNGACACSSLAGEFPCWNCVKKGRRSLPE